MSTEPAPYALDSAPQQSSARARFNRLRNRYGLVHAIAATIGRYSQTFWCAAGPAVTKWYTEKYLANHEKTYLNLGSGSLLIDGMLNVDYSPRADAFIDLTERMPYNDNSFNFVFCEEVIEHFPENVSFNILSEVYRILRPGGVARFTTPRLEWFIDHFHAEDPMGDDINGIFYGHGHGHIYSEKSLRAAMEKAGYCEVRFTDYKDQSSPLGKYDTHAERYGDDPMMSLYADGRKA